MLFLQAFLQALPAAAQPAGNQRFFCPTSCPPNGASGGGDCWPNWPVVPQSGVLVPSGTSSWSSDTFYTNEPGTVYASNAFCTFTIQNPMRRTLYVSFAIFRTEDCCDKLYVAIDGPASQPVASNMGPIVGARSISFTFRSDGSVASNARCDFR